MIYRTKDKIAGGKNRTMWHCDCECGNEVDVSADYLNRSKCSSCGCEATKNKIEKNGTTKVE